MSRVARSSRWSDCLNKTTRPAREVSAASLTTVVPSESRCRAAVKHGATKCSAGIWNQKERVTWEIKNLKPEWRKERKGKEEGKERGRDGGRRLNTSHMLTNIMSCDRKLGVGLVLATSYNQKQVNVDLVFYKSFSI